MHAADKLERLLSVVCEDPDNIVRWNNLLLSTLASKINKRIWDFPKTIIFEDQKIDVIPLRSKRCQESSKLAATVSSKLEDGDVRGAIRLAASDDTLAPFTDATLEELKLKHPPRAANTQLFSAANATTQSTQPNSLMLCESAILAAVRSFQPAWFCRWVGRSATSAFKISY